MNKDKLKLIAVTAAFALPIIFAFVMQPMKDELIEKGSISHGRLVTPQIELVDLAKHSEIKGTWTLVAFAGKHCDKECLDRTYRIQQVRLSQGEEAKRISRLLISNGKLPVTDLENLNPYLGTNFIRLTDSQYQALETVVKNGSKIRLEDNIYLIDPLGYYMMMFPSSMVPKGIIIDLKYLLKNSRIG